MENEIANYGHLSRQLKVTRDRLSTVEHIVNCGQCTFDMGTVDFLIPEINRLERIVSALESIGVNLDESDIEALESLASSGSYRSEREDFRTFANNATSGIIEDGREREQKQAMEALTAAGFVLDDEDGETWTRGGVTVKIECVHPAESMYKWEYEMTDPRPGSLRIADEGKSGDFHRLMALIGKTEVKQ